MGVIIGALIAVAGTIVSSVISSGDNENALKEGRRMAGIKRRDSLEVNRKQERLDKLTLQQRKRESRAQERIQREQLGQRKKEFASQEKESFYNKQMGLLNSNETMRFNFANNLFRRAA